MSNVVAFPHVSTECSGSTTRGLSRSELRAAAWTTHYAAERNAGASPHLARERTEIFINRHFDGLIDRISEIMSEDR